MDEQYRFRGTGARKDRFEEVLDGIDRSPWRDAPIEKNPHFSKVWKAVSVALQRKLRIWVPSIYFERIERLEDRRAAYPYLVYEASRPCFGTGTEFTYDVANRNCVVVATRDIGRPLKAALERIRGALAARDREALQLRYAPGWHEDIRREVLRRPAGFMRLLGDEAALVESVIDLGTSRSRAAAARFVRLTERRICRMTHTRVSAQQMFFKEATVALSIAQAGISMVRDCRADSPPQLQGEFS